MGNKPCCPDGSIHKRSDLVTTEAYFPDLVKPAVQRSINTGSKAPKAMGEDDIHLQYSALSEQLNSKNQCLVFDPKKQADMGYLLNKSKRVSREGEYLAEMCLLSTQHASPVSGTYQKNYNEHDYDLQRELAEGVDDASHYVHKLNQTIAHAFMNKVDHKGLESLWTSFEKAPTTRDIVSRLNSDPLEEEMVLVHYETEQHWPEQRFESPERMNNHTRHHIVLQEPLVDLSSINMNDDAFKRTKSSKYYLEKSTDLLSKKPTLDDSENLTRRCTNDFTHNSPLNFYAPNRSSTFKK